MNGKYYYGRHSTDNLDDGYLGSGTYFTRSVRKHGKENHVRIIVEQLPDLESLKLREAEIVNREILKDKMCMNIALGGDGGWDHIKHSHEARLQMGKAGGLSTKAKIDSDDTFRIKFSQSITDATLKSYANGRQKNVPSWLGKTHSEETKNKMSESKKNTVLGKNNPMFNKRWIHNLLLKQCKLISIDEMQIYLADGWIKGRKSF